MRIAQYSNRRIKNKDNKSFQQELWDQIWSKNSHVKLRNQLNMNPIYWRLKKRLKKDQRILEAGCGFGQWVSALVEERYNITGVDNAISTVSNLKKNFPNLRVDLGDVEKLPYKSGSFDVYLSFGVIEHFPEGPELVLKEAKRVLKKGGLLYLTVPYLNFPRFLRYGFKSNHQGNFYQYLYSKGEIVKRIKDVGFEIESVGHYDFVSAFKKDFPFLYRLMIKIITKNHKISVEKRVINNNMESEPDFSLQKILYRLDSYVLLIEARRG